MTIISVTCGTCGGSGLVERAGTHPRVCPACNGTGQEITTLPTPEPEPARVETGNELLDAARGVLDAWEAEDLTIPLPKLAVAIGRLQSAVPQAESNVLYPPSNDDPSDFEPETGGVDVEPWG